MHLLHGPLVPCMGSYSVDFGQGDELFGKNWWKVWMLVLNIKWKSKFFFCFFLFLFLMYINYLNCRSSLSWPLQSLGDPVQPVLLWQSFINWIIFLFWTLLFFLFVSCLEYIMPLKPICGHQGHEHSCSWFFCWGFEMSPLAPKARLRPS